MSNSKAGGAILGKKPLDQSDSPEVNLAVKSHQDGKKMFFKIKRNAPLFKLLTIYCAKRQFEYKTMRFLYNGERFLVKRTPEQLGMKDGDEIDAMMFQLGGGC